MIVPVHDEFLIIRNGLSFLMAARAGRHLSLCLETVSDELCQFLETDDLIVVSAPEGGDPVAGVILIELVRRYNTPLIILPKEHPGSRRLRYVVSAGQVITTSCSIRRGTHPEQHLICASEGLSGITLKGIPSGCEISSLPAGATAGLFKAGISKGPETIAAGRKP
jgi:hypothetical protein